MNPKYLLFFDCKITFLSYSEYSKYSQRTVRMDSLSFLKFLNKLEGYLRSRDFRNCRITQRMWRCFSLSSDIFSINLKF